MKMVTFGVNDGEELVVAFPVFVQDHTRESMTLYELETVKVPVTDTNLAANSYTEVETSKPYIAFNNDYYIQLLIPELHMCKQIWHSYYGEELFLVKHKSKHSCESAIYYNLSKEVINEYCSFKYFYNTTIMPSVLDGGPQIFLANILTPKRLICTYTSDMACPVPSHDYVLVNRSILCNCHMESGLTYLLKSIAFCETASADYTMSFALNLAFLHMIQDLWPGNFSQLPPGMTQEELTFPLDLTSNAEFHGQDPNGTYPILLMHEPQSLSALHSSLRARRTGRQYPFSFGPRQDYPIGHHKKGSFLFHLALHVFYSTTGIVVVVSVGPKIYACIKQGKLKALELHRGCPWDSMHINWGEVTLTNRDTNIRLPCNVQIPIREKSRLQNLMKGPDCTAHLMVLQGCTWYTVSTIPLHYPAIQKPFSPGSMNPLPPSSDDGTA